MSFIYTSIAWSPDGTKLAGVNDRGSFQIWDATTAQLLTSISSAGFSYDVDWSPDGSKIATGRNDRVEIWASDGQHLATLQDNGREVTSVAWNADGTKIASADVKGIVRIWNTSTNQIIQTFSGHTDIVYSVAWSPDETKLVSASADKSVRVWDATSGQTIQTLQNSDRVFVAAWSPDGTKFAYGGIDTSLQIVQTPSPTATATPSIRADLGLTMIVTNSNPTEGEVINYVLTYSNPGPSTANNVTITAPLPSGVTLQAANGAPYDASTGVFTLGNLIAGQNGNVSLQVQVKTGTAGQTYSMTATISSTTYDPNLGNNSATASFTVRQP
jgi:uncharacterized repeat protein (TIGR01451 family)